MPYNKQQTYKITSQIYRFLREEPDSVLFKKLKYSVEGMYESDSYNCYKIIATDMGLDKPWEEPEKTEPDSLVEQLRMTIKKVQDSVKET